MFRKAATRTGQSHWAVRCRDLRVAAVARLIVTLSSPVSDTVPSLVARKQPKPSTPWLAMCTGFATGPAKWSCIMGNGAPAWFLAGRQVPGQQIVRPVCCCLFSICLRPVWASSIRPSHHDGTVAFRQICLLPCRNGASDFSGHGPEAPEFPNLGSTTGGVVGGWRQAGEGGETDWPRSWPSWRLALNSRYGPPLDQGCC